LKDFGNLYAVIERKNRTVGSSVKFRILSGNQFLTSQTEKWSVWLVLL